MPNWSWLIAKNQMKQKEIQELKNKPAAELLKFIEEGRERLRVLKFDLYAGKVKDVEEIRELRRNLARALTFMKEEEIAEKNPNKK